MDRRSALFGVALATGLAPFADSRAQGSAYPSRPVTIVVPGAPGGGGDFTARLLASAIGGAMGQPVVVENRAGAGGNIAATFVARAQPDGYTILLAYSGTHVIYPALFANLPWDPVKSFTPVAMLVTAPQVIVVNNAVPAKTLQAFVAYAKANPGKVNYASSGSGSMQHIGSELLALRAGIRMTHIPYQGAGPALTDLLSGRVDMLLTTPPAVFAQIRSGAVRALAIASRTRHPMLPEVPTTAEAGVPGVESEAWFALFAPARTPKDVVDKLVEQVGRSVGSTEFRRKAEDAGTYATFMGPAELAAVTRRDLAKWSALVHQMNIKVE